MLGKYSYYTQWILTLNSLLYHRGKRDCPKYYIVDTGKLHSEGGQFTADRWKMYVIFKTKAKK